MYELPDNAGQIETRAVLHTLSISQVKIATEKAEEARVLKNLPEMTMGSLWSMRISERCLLKDIGKLYLLEGSVVISRAVQRTLQVHRWEDLSSNSEHPPAPLRT
ncbi:hypothetical protein H671_3g8787 [Cricetulus griseus]|uniref:Uncharacterized protein n=1 Tax=Cricetulus griseus TaxID=10029 RepID=A0A061IEK5_CRIGR|nr:hypothetical protein H671_3g8787 [Cricetulus griseus]